MLRGSRSVEAICSWKRLTHVCVSYVTTSLKIHAVKSHKQVHPKQNTRVDSSAVHAGRAQTLEKFFYDRNDHGRGSMFGWTWRSQIPCLDGKNRFHVWMDLALLAHLCLALVPLVDSGSNEGGFIGTASITTSSSISTSSSVYLLRTQSNQESLMRSKLPGYTSRRLHCCPCMLLHDSVQLYCPLHATNHRSIDRREEERGMITFINS